MSTESKFAEYYHSGLRLFRVHNLDRAIAEFTKAIRLDPGHADAYYCRGNVLFELGRIQDAEADYDVAKRLSKR